MTGALPVPVLIKSQHEVQEMEMFTPKMINSAVRTQPLLHRKKNSRVIKTIKIHTTYMFTLFFILNHKPKQKAKWTTVQVTEILEYCVCKGVGFVLDPLSLLVLLWFIRH